MKNKESLQQTEHTKSEGGQTEILTKSSVPVLVLAGGKGTRLFELTDGEIPKSLVRLPNNITYIDQLMDGLEGVGFDNFIFCLGIQADQIIQHLDERQESIGEKNYQISVEHEPLGTGGAIKLALDTYQIENPFLTVTSDAIYPYNEIPDLVRNFHQGSAIWAVTNTSVGTMSQYKGPVLEHESMSIIQNSGSAWFKEERMTEFKSKYSNIDDYIDSGHGIIDPVLFYRAFEMHQRLYPERKEICLFKDILPMISEMSRRRMLRGRDTLLQGKIQKGATLDLGTVDRHALGSEMIFTDE